ncbi:adenine deaminase [Segetibacter sp.]|uniref:adenine deaminase n=1 Tax=Segetibacter sp. TaxID=2231182 RepID=UPI0026305919|nr:adenine deaminase [Segetibacter sp.]MCW3081619.1 ade [Segetibacter sp.]
MKNNSRFFIKGKLVDITNKRIFAAKIEVANGIIERIEELFDEGTLPHFILPGFIDSHVHIESSMLIPSEFARLAVVHGTVATISDPHEIANVCGIKGVEYMLENGNKVPFKFNFGAPSCVPATTFETAGAALDARAVEDLLQRKEIKYLSEMMNFPGVLFNDEEVIQKIAASHKLNKPVDGHAPGLRGEDAKKYVDAGISTDHECFTAEEALEKLKLGMKILIREGSAAKNFEALAHLLQEHSGNMMFCSDDKHPDSLVEGHINKLCARAVAKGIDVFDVLQAACVNPVTHYKLNVGLLKEGDSADFIMAKDLISFSIVATYIVGELVAENGATKIRSIPSLNINHFKCDLTTPKDFEVLDLSSSEKQIPVIEALDGQLITNKLLVSSSLLKKDNNYLCSNSNEDILKIAVINRYHKAPIARGWIKNFGLKEGAIASSVAHDSHNIIVTGVDDESLCRAANLVITEKGGVSCVSKEKSIVLGLPVAGLMSHKDGYEVAQQYTEIDKMAKSLGSKLSAPFMTLSFMALLVIPHLKLSDKGLFDGDTFSFEKATD